MNINPSDAAINNITNLLTVIGQPVRIRILFITHAQEACVCHLEAVLGIRQAAISQHLMALRKAGLVETNRDGRNIYYRITNPGIIPVLLQSAALVGVDPDTLAQLGARPHPDCPCPQCNLHHGEDFSCQDLHPKRKKNLIPA